MRRLVLLALLALAPAACGDAETTDARGYTKAPLESANLLIRGEEPTAMAQLGEPDLPRPVLDVAVPGQGAGGEGTQPQEVRLAPGVTQEQYDAGRQLFSGQGACQACHGPNGSGSQLGPDLTDDQWLHVSGPDVEELAGVIRSGVAQPVEHPAPMPPMGGASLDDEQVQALAAYVASIGQG